MSRVIEILKDEGTGKAFVLLVEEHGKKFALALSERISANADSKLRVVALRVSKGVKTGEQLASLNEALAVLKIKRANFLAVGSTVVLSLQLALNSQKLVRRLLLVNPEDNQGETKFERALVQRLRIPVLLYSEKTQVSTTLTRLPNLYILAAEQVKAKSTPSLSTALAPSLIEFLNCAERAPQPKRKALINQKDQPVV